MTQAERSALASPGDIADLRPRLAALRRRLGAARPTPRRPGPTWSTASSCRRSATRLQIPLIYGVDAVHGHNNVVGATIFPHNIGLGATRDPALVEQDGRGRRRPRSGRPGSPWDFAPVPVRRARRALGPHLRVASVRTRRWSRDGDGDRRACRARAGKDLTADKVLATAKHFVGDGGTDVRLLDHRLVHDRPGRHQVTRRSSRRCTSPPFERRRSSAASARSCRPTPRRHRRDGRTRSRCTPTAR